MELSIKRAKGNGRENLCKNGREEGTEGRSMKKRKGKGKETQKRKEKRRKKGERERKKEIKHIYIKEGNEQKEDFSDNELPQQMCSSSTKFF